jgi:two-component system cell cycle response regulator DivK
MLYSGILDRGKFSPTNQLPAQEVKKSEGRKPFVIVAGDNEETRFMLRSLLEMWDFDVAESCDGPGSVAAAAAHLPDLILMDVTLPYDESLKTMSFIKRNLPKKNVPLVVVSGFSRADMVDAAISHGATEFLVKPLDYDGLAGYLNSVIAGKQ